MHTKKQSTLVTTYKVKKNNNTQIRFEQVHVISISRSEFIIQFHHMISYKLQTQDPFYQLSAKIIITTIISSFTEICEFMAPYCMSLHKTIIDTWLHSSLETQKMVFVGKEITVFGL